MFVSGTCSSSSFLGLANAWPGAGERGQTEKVLGGSGMPWLTLTNLPGAILYSLELCDRDTALKMPTLSLPISHSFLGKTKS